MADSSIKMERQDKFLQRGDQLKLERLARKGILKIASYIPERPLRRFKRSLGRSPGLNWLPMRICFGPLQRSSRPSKKELPNIHVYPEGPVPI